MPDGLSVELFKEIAKQAVEAAGPHNPRIVPFDKYADRIVVLPGGEAAEVKGLPSPRGHVVMDLDSFAKAAKAAADAGGVNSTVCWVNRNGITLVMDDNGDRENTVQVPLRLSPQLRELMAIETVQTPFNQRDLIQTLRIKFANCGLPTNLVDNLRKVRFTNQGEANSEVTRAKVSVGREQMAQFHGIDTLPDWVVFQVPVFNGVFRTSASINVAVDPDPELQQFRLVPQLGAIEQSLQAAEIALVQALAGIVPETVPVYFGSP